MKTAVSLMITAWMASISASQVFAQAKPSTIYGPMADAGQTNLPGQKIGPNDLVAISVYDAPELTRTVRVAADGMIALPMVKRRIAAAGSLPSELEIAIATALQDGGILVDPIVAVTIAEYHSRPISVMGAVKKPLTFQAVANLKLLEALGRAEGLSAEAGPEIVVTRRSAKADGAQEVIRINVRELIDLAKPELNIALVGGEEVRVPEARKIYVGGNVRRPGAYSIRDSSQMTVMKALTLAEGVTPFYMKQVVIIRSDPASGGKKEIPVELAKILKRESPDVPLESEDMLYVQENTRRKTAVTLAERASSFGLATISGVLIWRGR